MPKMRLKAASIPSAGLIALALALPLVFSFLHTSSGLLANPAVNGTIEYNGNQRILNLWGTNYEMGYAHGYLMAGEIRDIVDTFMVGTIAHGSGTEYTAFLNAQEQYVSWPAQYLDEIRGLEAGMLASGKSLYVSTLGRNIAAKDIKALNLLPEFYVYRNPLGFGEMRPPMAQRH